MRRILTGVVLALGVTLALPAASLVDDGRVAAAKEAADEFLRRAEGGAQSGNMPRRSEPDIAKLLDTVFDLSALGTEVLPISKVGPIGDLARNGNRIGLAYMLAGTGRTDTAGADAKMLEHIDRNTVTFAPEMGQFTDFQIGTTSRMAQSALGFIEVTPRERLEQVNIKAGLSQMRAGFTQTIGGMLKTFTIRGLEQGWKARRLAVLESITDTARRFLEESQKAGIKQLADQVALVVGPELKPRVEAFGQRVAAAP